MKRLLFLLLGFFMTDHAHGMFNGMTHFLHHQSTDPENLTHLPLHLIIQSKSCPPCLTHRLATKRDDLELRASGQTPLHIAAAKGKYFFIEILIEAGAQINALSEGEPSYSALELAMCNRQSCSVRKLLEHHAIMYERTVLLATHIGFPLKELVESLLEEGVAITTQPDPAVTPPPMAPPPPSPAHHHQATEDEGVAHHQVTPAFSATDERTRTRTPSPLHLAAAAMPQQVLLPTPRSRASIPRRYANSPIELQRSPSPHGEARAANIGAPPPVQDSPLQLHDPFPPDALANDDKAAADDETKPPLTKGLVRGFQQAASDEDWYVVDDADEAEAKRITEAEANLHTV